MCLVVYTLYEDTRSDQRKKKRDRTGPPSCQDTELQALQSHIMKCRGKSKFEVRCCRPFDARGREVGKAKTGARCGI